MNKKIFITGATGFIGSHLCRKLLKLNNPIYKKTASYGHFGRKELNDGSFSWEALNLKSLFQKI